MKKKNFIDADKLKAEIERRKGYISVTHFAEELLSVINSLPTQEDIEDFSIYHPLKCNGVYESFAYSFKGSITAFSDPKDLVEFLRTCFFTEKECEDWCEQENNKTK